MAALTTERSQADSVSASCAQAIRYCTDTVKEFPASKLSQAELRFIYTANRSWRFYGPICVRPTKPVVTAELVRARVTRLLPIASVGLAPRDATLVNIQTVMWVDAPGLKDLPGVRILGQRVLIRLSDPSVRYDFGDGSVLDAQSAGKAYSESDPCRTRLCPDYYGHIYRASGHRTVTAAVHWHVSFTVDGGGRVRVPGTVDGPAASAPIVVREARSVLVRNP